MLPDFRALLRDVYAAHAKAVVTLADRGALPGSAALRHKLVTELVGDQRYVELHRLTQLRPSHAGLATLRVGRALVEELAAGRLMLSRELGAQFFADKGEQELEELEREAESARILAERHRHQGDELQRALEVEADALEEAAEAVRETLDQGQHELDEAARQVPGDVGSKNGNGIAGRPGTPPPVQARS